MLPKYLRQLQRYCEAYVTRRWPTAAFTHLHYCLAVSISFGAIAFGIGHYAPVGRDPEFANQLLPTFVLRDYVPFEEKYQRAKGSDTGAEAAMLRIAHGYGLRDCHPKTANTAGTARTYEIACDGRVIHSPIFLTAVVFLILLTLLAVLVWFGYQMADRFILPISRRPPYFVQIYPWEAYCCCFRWLF
jgi:hypothetical protein